MVIIIYIHVSPVFCLFVRSDEVRRVIYRKLTSSDPLSHLQGLIPLLCVFPSVSQCAAGGHGSVVVERGVQAVQVSDRAELLPQRVPGPAHRPGAAHGSKHMSRQGTTSLCTQR